MRSTQRMIDPVCLPPAFSSASVSSPSHPPSPLSAVAECPACPWRCASPRAEPPAQSATSRADDNFRHAQNSCSLTIPPRQRVGALRIHAGARGTSGSARTTRFVRLVTHVRAGRTYQLGLHVRCPRKVSARHVVPDHAELASKYEGGQRDEQEPE
jgi:hypothetical protein